MEKACVTAHVCTLCVERLGLEKGSMFARRVERSLFRCTLCRRVAYPLYRVGRRAPVRLVSQMREKRAV